MSGSSDGRDQRRAELLASWERLMFEASTWALAAATRPVKMADGESVDHTDRWCGVEGVCSLCEVRLKLGRRLSKLTPVAQQAILNALAEAEESAEHAKAALPPIIPHEAGARCQMLGGVVDVLGSSKALRIIRWANPKRLCPLSEEWDPSPLLAFGPCESGSDFGWCQVPHAWSYQRV